MTGSWVYQYPGLISGVLLGVGSAGFLLYHRKTIAQAVHLWRMFRSIRTTKKTIRIVTSEEGWAEVMPLLYRKAQQDGAVGFDCEWVQVRGRRRPVALLQLATCSGLCVLVRLSHMKPNFPQTLKDFLEDETILKVGVGPLEDSNYLTGDYGLKVKGCVDLRYLVLRSQKSELTGSSQSSNPGKSVGGMGLSSLAHKYLGRTLDKDWRIRASDWEAVTLTRRQKTYAAEDALVGIHILMVLMETLLQSPSSLVPFQLPAFQCHHLPTAIHQTCEGCIDIKFCSSNKQQEIGGVQSSQQRPPLKQKVSTRGHPMRKGPLYFNCQLRAPDDEPLCTIAPTKARWYVEKGLGVLVSEEPLVVRLKFEPAGRPQTEKEDGRFYLQNRENVCVVCGKDESYIRKNVVPHEYRKHFPAILKHHQNHDVLLLCFECHRQSNMYDNLFRSQLAREFDAPVGVEQNFKVAVDNSRKIVRNAGRALLKNRDNIPEKKVFEMEKVIKDFFKVHSISVELLQDAANMDVKVLNEGFQAHGEKIYEAYEKCGLVKLEQRWRQHFLDVMKPKYMPECWSVNHNVYKMGLKMSRLPLNHPNRLIYKMALVGTEGTIDIPYDPQPSREITPLSTSSAASRDTTPEYTIPSSRVAAAEYSTSENVISFNNHATLKSNNEMDEGATVSSHNKSTGNLTFTDKKEQRIYKSSTHSISNHDGTNHPDSKTFSHAADNHTKLQVMEELYDKIGSGEMHSVEEGPRYADDSDDDVVIEDDYCEEFCVE